MKQTSGTARGPVIVLLIVYGIFALSATARSLVQILREFDRAPVAYLLSLFAALTYIAMTLVLLRRGPASRAAVALVLVELVGVFTVGTLSLLVPAWFPEATVWSEYGIGYGFVPALLPVLAGVLIYRARSSAGQRGSTPRAAEGP